jgi:hypothetical protein
MKYKKYLPWQNAMADIFLLVILVMKQMQVNVMVLRAIFKHLLVLFSCADLAFGRDLSCLLE